MTIHLSTQALLSAVQADLTVVRADLTEVGCGPSIDVLTRWSLSAVCATLIDADALLCRIGIEP